MFLLCGFMTIFTRFRIIKLTHSTYVTGSEKRYIVAHIFKIELLAPQGRASSRL